MNDAVRDDPCVRWVSVSLDLDTAEPRQFSYLSGGAETIAGVHDDAAMMVTLRALRRLGFSELDLQGVFRALAGVLHLGNIAAPAVPQQSLDRTAVARAASILQVTVTAK